MIYAQAKILGLIGSVRDKLDALRLRGFRLADRHYEQILREVGELTMPDEAFVRIKAPPIGRKEGFLIFAGGDRPCATKPTLRRD
jgi:Domain of unknown function (DUF3368)